MKDKCFEAGNLYLATYLLYCGFAMKGIEDRGGLKGSCLTISRQSIRHVKNFTLIRRRASYLIVTEG